jgi:hypothetical protein
MHLPLILCLSNAFIEEKIEENLKKKKNSGKNGAMYFIDVQQGF